MTGPIHWELWPSTKLNLLSNREQFPSFADQEQLGVILVTLCMPPCGVLWDGAREWECLVSFSSYIFVLGCSKIGRDPSIFYTMFQQKVDVCSSNCWGVWWLGSASSWSNQSCGSNNTDSFTSVYNQGQHVLSFGHHFWCAKTLEPFYLVLDYMLVGVT